MARWLDLATWRGPTINEGDGDGRPLEPEDRLREVRGLVIHIAEGYFEGTISWQKNPDANVSSHFVGARDGRRAQMVDTADRAWTQSSGNPYWMSLENEGFTLGHRLHKAGWEKLTAQQIEFAAQLLARLHREHGVPLRLARSTTERGLAYHSLGAETGVAWGHDDCPGEPIKAQLPLILARAVEIAGGEDMDVEEFWHRDIDSNPARSTSAGTALLTLHYELPGKLAALGTRLEAIEKTLDGLPTAPALSDEQLDALADRVADKLADKIAARLAS